MIDPIVDEVRRTRARIFQECNEDLHLLVERLRAAETQDRDRMVTPEMVREKRKREAAQRREIK